MAYLLSMRSVGWAAVLSLAGCGAGGVYPFADVCPADVGACDIRDAECTSAWFTFMACVRQVDAGNTPPVRVVTEAEALALTGTSSPASAARLEVRRALVLADLLAPSAVEDSGFDAARLDGVTAFYRHGEDAVFVIDRGKPLDEYADIFAHEAVHALQDRELDLDAYGDQWIGDDDQALALASIIEGEAETYQWLAKAVIAGEDFIPVPASGIPDDRFVAETAAQSSPLFAARGIFPYVQGESFVEAALAAGSREAVRELFANPPRSTRQIRLGYRADPDRSQVEAARRALPVAPEVANFQRIGAPTLGEWVARVFLARHGASTALEWAGDDFQVYTGADRRAFLWGIALHTPYDGGATIPGVNVVARPHALVLWQSTAGNFDAPARAWADAIDAAAP